VAGRIFVSYRRADTANQAGWLAERLAGHYGRPQVIKDVDSIQLGNDFAEVIAAAVTSCDALLALIGHQWLAAAAGPNDFVRVEIESALTRGIRVIPVLVDGGRMPTAAELPPGLAMLAQQSPLSLGVAVVAAIVAFIAIPQRPPRVIGVVVVRARVGVGGDGLASQCLTQAQQLAERLCRGQGPAHGRLLHQQGRLGR
jgi:hypothetical protein